jgi:hypothetical protein
MGLAKNAGRPASYNTRSSYLHACPPERIIALEYNPVHATIIVSTLYVDLPVLCGASAV